MYQFNFNEPTDDVLVPVFFPETLLAMDVPINVMNNAIAEFNQRLETEGNELLIRENGVIQAKISLLVRTNSNLFMQLIVPRTNIEKAQCLKARLMGYVVMHKETAAVEQLVIEGFKFVRASNSQSVFG